MKRPRYFWGLSGLLFALLLALPAFADDAAPSGAAAAAAAAAAAEARFRRYRLDADQHRAGADDDHSGPGACSMPAWCARRMCWRRMMQSFAICCIVTIVWMVAGYSIAFTNGNAYMGDFSRVHAERHRRAHLQGNDSQAFMLACGHQDVATCADHPRDRLHDVPDDLRDHHAGADRRRVRRPHEVLRSVHLHGAVVAAGLFADRPLGVGADRAGSSASWARWTSRAAPSCISTPASPACVLPGAGQARRLRQRQHGAV